jgi:hypothetical protein
MVRGVRILDVPTICDPIIRIATQMLSFKLLWKCRMDQIPSWVITVTKIV